MPINKVRERKFIELMAMGVRPTTAAKAAGYGLGDKYRGALMRMARRDMKSFHSTHEEVTT